MDKLKYVKLENPDGTYSDSVPLSVDSDYVDVNGNTLTNELNKKANADNLNVLTNRVNNLAHLEEGSTTGDAELIDTRVSFDGIIYPSAGDSVRAQASEQIHQSNYLVINESLANGENDIDVSVDITYEKPLYVKVVNNSSSDGYFDVQARWSDANNLFNNTISKLVSHNNSEIFELKNPKHCTVVRVKNNNNLANCKVFVYQNMDNFIKNESNDTKSLYNNINGNRFIQINGYINQSGAQASSSDYKINISDCAAGDKFIINSKSIGWATLWGYENDGTPHAITTNKTYINEIITIPDNLNITYIGFTSKNDRDDSIQRYTYIKELDDNIKMKNYNCYDYNNLTTQSDISNATVVKSNNTIVASITDNTSNARVNYTSNTNVTENNSLVSTRFKIQANGYMKLSICTYTTLSNLIYYYFDLEPNKTYELYTFTKNLATSSIKFEFKSLATENTTATQFTITDFEYVINSTKVYKDFTEYQTMKNFDSNIITVDTNGDGNFYNIPEAIDFLKNNRDVANIPTLIFIKNGKYKVYPTNTYPYAPINKGANKISIMGESRDGVVISCTNTADTQSKVLDIGGECTIEDLTINCLKDESYTAENDLHHNCYCIHNDTNYNSDSSYITKIKNCKLYSECHSPVGAGLQNNQTQIYENVETISNGILSNGSMYVHGPANSAASNCAVIINNCNCQALDGKKALTLPDVSGSLQYTDIDTTIQRTICYSNGTKIIDDNFKIHHKLTNMSALNNITDLNY